ncbi:MAG: hypothetical protein ACI4MP_13500 [Candidatus Ventricola sp.]
MTILIECVALCLLFTVVVATVSLKDPLAGVHNWPPAIQQRAREMGLIREQQMAGSKGVAMKKLAAALLFAAIFAAVVYFVNGARSFAAGFGISYLIWTVVNWYDAIVIDCLWICHDKRVRIPGTEDMKAYQDYWFHIRASLRGQVIGLPIALVAGGLTEALARL